MNAIDLFAGAGGLSIALENSGFKILLANEINPRFAETHRHNFPNVLMVEKDINELGRTELKEIIGDEEVDLIVGGPPCQGFSVFGKRRFINTQDYDPHKDPRNFLVYQYIRIVEEVRPKFFFMENVKGFTNLDKGLFVEEVKKQFIDLGYTNIWCQIVCAADYGVPQERYRMFMIGNRIGVDFEAPIPSHHKIGSGDLPEYTTVGDAIMDLVGKENTISNHVPLSHKPIVAARYGYVKEGCKLNLDDLPPELAVATRRDSKTGKVSNYSHVYKRLDRSKPSTTMVPGHNAFPIHPTLNRTLTAREAARIQTFPDSHVFFGTRQEQCIQVGNAVPPKMAEPFLRKIAEYLSRKEE
ncbi:MAG: DNA cytosine methyltransferase [Clostridiales bacterium]|nr:DNA cytosine methyltransferase [Clostridiales bacterium]